MAEFDEQFQGVRNMTDKPYIGQYDGRKITFAPGEIKFYHPNLVNHLIMQSVLNGLPQLEAGLHGIQKPVIQVVPEQKVFVCQLKNAKGEDCLQKFPSDSAEWVDHQASHRLSEARKPVDKAPKKDAASV